MIRTILIIASVALALVSSALFGAPASEPASQPTQIEIAFQKAATSRPSLSEIHSAALSNALSRPDRLVDFITNPQTNYADRMGAAMQGANLVPVQQMPTVLHDRDELDHEFLKCGWGLLPNPMSQTALPYFDDHADSRMVLGRWWDAPPKRLPYPITWEEESKAPWPWQVQQALDTLFVEMGWSARGHGPDACTAWLDTAMSMPWRTDDEAIRLVQATKEINGFSTPAVMARWRQIVANPQTEGAASIVAFGIGDYVRSWNNERAQGLVQLILLELLKRPPELRRRLFQCYPEDLRGPNIDNGGPKLPVPATTVLEVAKLLQDSVSGGDVGDFPIYATFICQVVDDPPIDVGRGVMSREPLALRTSRSSVNGLRWPSPIWSKRRRPRRHT